MQQRWNGQELRLKERMQRRRTLNTLGKSFSTHDGNIDGQQQASWKNRSKETNVCQRLAESHLVPYLVPYHKHIWQSTSSD